MNRGANYSPYNIQNPYYRNSQAGPQIRRDRKSPTPIAFERASPTSLRTGAEFSAALGGKEEITLITLVTIGHHTLFKGGGHLSCNGYTVSGLL